MSDTRSPTLAISFQDVSNIGLWLKNRILSKPTRNGKIMKHRLLEPSNDVGRLSCVTSPKARRQLFRVEYTHELQEAASAWTEITSDQPPPFRGPIPESDRAHHTQKKGNSAFRRLRGNLVEGREIAVHGYKDICSLGTATNQRDCSKVFQKSSPRVCSHMPNKCSNSNLLQLSLFPLMSPTLLPPPALPAAAMWPRFPSIGWELP